MESYILSLDQGTTSSRAVLINSQGEIVKMAQKEITQVYPKSGWVEEDPEEIYDSVLYTISEIIDDANISEKQIKSIGITNQRETTILWNKITGKPIYNAIVWQCKRGKQFCDELEKNGYRDIIQVKTGLIIDPYFSASKIRWILDNVDGVEDDLKAGNILFGTVDTWLLWKLTEGKSHFTDVSNASRTMLFNINKKEWDNELLKLFGIPKSILPIVRSSASDFGYISSDILGEKIPINSLLGDQQSSLFGQLCTNRGDLKNTYGTGCFTLMNIGEKPIISNSGLLTTIAWEIDGKCHYALEGSVFVGGAVIQWLRDELELISNADESEVLAESVTDSNGVIFLSTFQGIGTPYWVSGLKAEIKGITRGTKRAHIVRAALESIAFRSMEVIDTMKKDSGIEISTLMVDGGACKNNFLMRFQSGISQIKLVRPLNVESTSLGAAFMAGLHVGFWDSIDQLKAIKKSDTYFNEIMDSNERSNLIKGWKKAVEEAIGGLNGSE